MLRILIDLGSFNVICVKSKYNLYVALIDCGFDNNSMLEDGLYTFKEGEL